MRATDRRLSTEFERRQLGHLDDATGAGPRFEPSFFGAYTGAGDRIRTLV
jgi:hypothetical protein